MENNSNKNKNKGKGSILGSVFKLGVSVVSAVILGAGASEVKEKNRQKEAKNAALKENNERNG